MAVAAARDHYHDAALGQHGVGRGQALGTLVEVLVERIAAVGYNSYVAIYALYARERAQELASGLVRGLEVPGEAADDLAFAVEHHVTLRAA